MCTILASSIMFQEDVDEPSLWLASLPSTRRSGVSKAPDGASISDEGESVITFLDDCMQRCLKTPYRYVDDMNDLKKRNTENVPDKSDRPVERLDSYLSPLLMTLLEQLGAKISHELLSISDILALATFTRRLLFRLITKQRDLTFLRSFTDRIDGCLRLDAAAFPYLTVVAAIRREVSIMHYCLDVTRASPASHGDSNITSLTFLNDTENLQPRQSSFSFPFYVDLNTNSG
jgi:nucleolar pre-ribosomal-associated protein 1